jgi:peptidyl-tRNA hydrolase, PTH1 family
MWLIVGLGNPGMEYAWTPHNMGFLAIDRLAEKGGIRVERPEAKSLIGRGALAGKEVILAQPQTMMNLSGLAVRDLLSRFEVELANLVVLYDEVDLAAGVIRVLERGSAGTHNGMKSVIGSLATQDVCRVRIGIRPDHPLENLRAYVLHPMRKSELAVAAETIEMAAEAVETILSEGVTRAMNKFNRRNPPLDPETKN